MCHVDVCCRFDIFAPFLCVIIITSQGLEYMEREEGFFEEGMAEEVKYEEELARKIGAKAKEKKQE